MAKPTNLTEDREQYRPPPSVAELFGEDLGPPLFTDQAPKPAPGSSAARHAGRRQANDRAAQVDRELAQLGNVAQEAREDDALERAVNLLNWGGTPGAGSRALAVRALARRGGVGLSSAEVMAARALSGGRQLDQDQDDDRRHGRRPRR